MKSVTQLQEIRSYQPFQGEVAAATESISRGHHPRVICEVAETIPGVWARYVISDDGDVVIAGEGPIK